MENDDYDDDDDDEDEDDDGDDDVNDDDDDDDDDDGNKRVGREPSAHGMRLRHADDLGKGSVSLKLNNIFF